MVVWEVGFADYAEFAAWNSAFWAAPRVSEFNDARLDLTERGGGEVWHVEQFG